jgi:hypothetical protein
VFLREAQNSEGLAAPQYVSTDRQNPKKIHEKQWLNTFLIDSS